METKENKTNTGLQVKKSDITDSVLAKVNELNQMGDLKIPSDYSPENALKSAYLFLVEQKTRDGKPVLESCTKESIANTLFDMVIQGLSRSKQQCYFIPYGDKLMLQRSYTGTMAVAKRVAPVKSITANCIYEGDNFVYNIEKETGYKKLIIHEQRIENLDINKIIGAYATIQLNDGSSFIEPMTIKEIETAWQQGATKGASPAHKNFRQEMCKKTAIGRACKLLINSSNDADMYEGNDDQNRDEVVERRNKIVEEKGNAEVVEFEEVKAEKPEDKKEPQPQTQPLATELNFDK